MSTYRKWTWCDEATEERRNCPINTAAVKRLADEARSLYDSIPEVRQHDDCDDRDDGGPEFDSREEEEAYDRAKKAKRTDAFGQLDAIEEMMAARGARFTREYEHHQEFERHYERMEA